MVNYVLTHKYRRLGCHYFLLKNELHKCNAFLSRHYWFGVSLKSIHNSYLSCRLFLDSWENPFKARAGRRQETREAVSENWRDRKWKGERSSQSPNIPTRRVPGGCEVKGEGGFWMTSTAVCHEECTMPPHRDPQSHHFHRQLPITHLGLILPSRQVSRQNRGLPSLLFVCHLLTSSQPRRALLIRTVIDNSKWQTRPKILHQITMLVKPRI